MRQRRVLIVEDDPMVALDLEAILLGATEGITEIAVAGSVGEALRVLDEAGFDAAFLDIDVRDGRTFGLAGQLHARGTPFAFVSGARRDEVPPHLQQVPFLPKPYDPQDIEQTFLTGLDSRE
jgi:DNA-binding LytR/AlgR family response regulator